MPLWLRGETPQSDVVLSTRIRLARNLKEIPFPSMLRQKEDIQKVKELAKEALSAKGNSDFIYYDMESLNAIDKQALTERYLISRELAENPNGAVILGRDETLSVMIMEEDHYRLQCILGGLQLNNAYAIADELDNILSRSAGFAFDEKLGYLTSCPTNVGTGMRASVMLHLPALVLAGAIGGVLKAIGKIGLTARGTFGEGTEAAGNVFQISNQVTLGLSEKEILENLSVSVERIIESERQARNTIAKAWNVELQDRICRALGVLKYARKLTTEELLRHISDINLGVALKIIRGVGHTELYSLMMDTRPALLMLNKNDKTPLERDVQRAEITRNALKEAD
jgi:protein arginine kinase